MTGNDAFGSIAGATIVGGVSSWATGGDFVQGALAGGYGMAFNDVMHPQTMGQMARKLLKEDHNTTPERLPKDLVKGAYNVANKVINSEYTYAMAKAYMAVSPLLPELWPGTPIVGAYVYYWEGMVPGGSWPDLK